jgi:hypothetical protein
MTLKIFLHYFLKQGFCHISLITFCTNSNLALLQSSTWLRGELKIVVCY